MTLPRAVSSRWRTTLAAAAAAVVALPLLGDPGVAASTNSAFGDLQGSWGGTGTVTYKSGTKERLRCRVQYTQQSATDLQQALRCASDSYKFQINAYFKGVNGTLSGRWSELTMELSGTISGSLVDGKINGKLNGPGFAAAVQVTTTGTKQIVYIEAPPDQDITNVAIEVTKGGR